VRLLRTTLLCLAVGACAGQVSALGDVGGGSGGGMTGGGGEATGGGAATGGGTGGGGGGAGQDAGLPLVHFLGRFDFGDGGQGPRADWSGSAWVTRFRGTGIRVALTGGANQFAALVDDGQPTVVKFAGDAGVVTVASGLSDAEHTLALSRRTEASFGPVRFDGFTVTGGALVPSPPPFTRKLEFVGDSITCGYGNEGAVATCAFSPNTENEYLAYGALTARALDAEHRVVAWSGLGMVRNYADRAGPRIPELYGRTLATDAASLWDTSRWVPDVVVINLGTNDFSTGVNPGQPFADAYLQFVTRLRGLYPQAHIFCAVGPMDNDSTLRGYVTGVVTARAQAGDDRVHFIEFPPQGALGYGCDSHPNVATHALMATAMTSAIRAALGW
jgi:lysophospholipase L1-like esterase